MSSVTISFVLDSERDSVLLGWLKTHGKRGRSAAIREALRQHLLYPQAVTIDGVQRIIRLELASYALRGGGSGLDVQSPEPEQAAANLDGLTDRLEEW